MPAEETIRQVWTISLAVYFAVVIVVAVLLTLILGTARRIREAVSAIWTVGQKVANNTIHIALLDQTNHAARKILGEAAAVAGAAGEIERHSAACPRCPDCVTGPAGRRA